MGEYPPRRRFRNSRDPEWQGNGWRWTLSLWLPYRLSMLVLTPEQRDACWAEWEATQQEFAKLHVGRELNALELDILARRQGL